jgi:hypothetical protein
MYAPRDLSAKVTIKTAMCVCSKERQHTVTIPQKSNMVPELGHAASTSPSTTQSHRSFSPPLNRRLLAHFARALLLHARPRAGCGVVRTWCEIAQGRCKTTAGIASCAAARGLVEREKKREFEGARLLLCCYCLCNYNGSF